MLCFCVYLGEINRCFLSLQKILTSKLIGELGILLILGSHLLWNIPQIVVVCIVTLIFDIVIAKFIHDLIRVINYQ